MNPTAQLRLRRYHDLMPYQVHEILLVSSVYDLYILQEDGPLTEQVFLEYRELSLPRAPRFTHAASGEEALERLATRRFDLVLVVTRLPDMDVRVVASAAKENDPGRPVIVLAYDRMDRRYVESLQAEPAIDAVMAWTGDAKCLLAMTKYVEDIQNVDHDIDVADVRVILVVEDSIEYYSAFLSVLYPELMSQSQSLFAEGLNRLQRLMRMRTRPKVVHAGNYEDAVAMFDRYRDNLLAVITDAGYPKDGEHDMGAGVDLIDYIRREAPSLPVLMQSAEEQFRAPAMERNALFVNKASSVLLSRIRNFLRAFLGFGPFVFRLPGDAEVARARTIEELIERVREVAGESLEYHARRDHFSNWLMARSEFELAQRIKPVRVSDFGDTEEMRAYILRSLRRLRQEEREGVIADFSPGVFEHGSRFQRIGSGALGGKARSLAFLDLMLASARRRGGNGVAMDVQIPQTFVLATDAFEEFLSANDLEAVVRGGLSDEEVFARFLEAEMPAWVEDALRTVVENVDYPLVVRSSSLLEDNLQHGFAGVYATVMLATGERDPERDLAELLRAVCYVYASTYFRSAREHLSQINRRIEEEQMAVVVQQLVGHREGTRFFPHLSGVARSSITADGEPVDVEDVSLVFGLRPPTGRTGRARRIGLPAGPVPGEGEQSAFLALDVSATHGGDGLPGQALVMEPVVGAADAVAAARATASSPALDQGLRHVLGLMSDGYSAPVEVEFACDLTAERPGLFPLQARAVERTGPAPRVGGPDGPDPLPCGEGC